jgi:hypothetical protein
MVSLDVYRGLNRVLLVFAPSDEDPDFQHQITSATDYQSELAERDLIVRAFPSSGDEEESDFRKHYGVPADGFTVILIGKDGTEKMRRDEPILSDDLISTIDAMPMRRQEMDREG